MSDDTGNIFAKMSDRRDIVFFVREIEKNPCLYDQNSYEYANKDLKRRIWLEIAKKCHSSVPDCKEKWRKIRIAYNRSLKQCHGDNPPSRPYYLSNYLQFITPSKYADDVPTTNTAPSPTPSEDSYTANVKGETDNFDDDTSSIGGLEVVENTNDIYLDGYQKPKVLHIVQNNKQRDIDKALNLKSNGFKLEMTSRPKAEVSNRSQTVINSTNNILHNIPHNRPQVEINKSFFEKTDVNSNIQSRKRSSCCDDRSPRKMFLLSLLPDVESLSDQDMRIFRREVIGLIDNMVSRSSLTK